MFNTKLKSDVREIKLELTRLSYIIEEIHRKVFEKQEEPNLNRIEDFLLTNPMENLARMINEFKGCISMCRASLNDSKDFRKSLEIMSKVEEYLKPKTRKKRVSKKIKSIQDSI